jgi:hypothetical protein
MPRKVRRTLAAAGCMATADNRRARGCRCTLAAGLRELRVGRRVDGNRLLLPMSADRRKMSKPRRSMSRFRKSILISA